jgi:acyl-coenzyme A thioesterase PaaI-like protein
VKKQPNSRMCFICGLENPVGLRLEIYETNPGVIETSFTPPEHFQGYPGVLHGGIVATILDEISGRALMGDPSQPRFMFTAKLEVKYRQTVPIGKPIRIVGKAGQTRGRTAEGWAGMYDETGTLLAEANTLLVDVPSQILEKVDPEALGWKIYPD